MAVHLDLFNDDVAIDDSRSSSKKSEQLRIGISTWQAVSFGPPSSLLGPVENMTLPSNYVVPYPCRPGTLQGAYGAIRHAGSCPRPDDRLMPIPRLSLNNRI